MSNKSKSGQEKEMEKQQDINDDVSPKEETEIEVQSEEPKAKKAKGKKKKQSATEELGEMKVQYAELTDKYLRLFADFENYRRNANKEKIELIKTASQGVIESLLPVLDDFDRALNSMKEHGADDEAINGVELIYNKMFNTLKQKGLQPMDSQGKDFDTDFHDAITQIPAPSDDLKGKVVDVIEKGYLLNDKIIRHAKVVVGK